MKQLTLLPEMIALPSVFAVEDRYVIFIPFSAEVIMRVRVGDRLFYDDCNGVMRSRSNMHRVEIPMSVLDEAGSYTVLYNKMIERSPYYPTSEPEQSLTVPFCPLPKQGDLRIYHIADAHNMVKEPIAAASYFAARGEQMDLLVLNGDIPNHSGNIKNFDAICEITGAVTGGQIPAVFARGNHDCRGIHAEDMPAYIPVRNGKTYFTFRLGRLWGMVLDCGEDKRDGCREYGGTVCFHEFRLAQTDYIRSVIARSACEYEAPGVEYRVVISHIPFTQTFPAPFDIEHDLYREWAALLGAHVKPHLMLHGHKHRIEVIRPGDEQYHLGLPCPSIIGSRPTFADEEHPNWEFEGCALTLSGSVAHVVFNNDRGEIVGQEDVNIG